MMVVAVFLAGVLGGGTAAMAFSQPANAAPCPLGTCAKIGGKCIPCE